ncbi:protein of unknown function [Pseudomonas mediterranea]
MVATETKGQTTWHPLSIWIAVNATAVAVPLSSPKGFTKKSAIAGTAIHGCSSVDSVLAAAISPGFRHLIRPLAAAPA